MKVAFISGPFRADSAWEIEANIRRAEAVALKYWREGYAVICPHTNTRFFQGAAADAVWLEGDLAILRRCDVIVMCEGWSRSQGSIAELSAARAAGLRVIMEAAS